MAIGNYPASDAQTISPSDSKPLPGGPCRKIWVGTTGDVRITTQAGTVTVLKNVPSGTSIDVITSQVWATGTSASDLVALY